MFYNKGKGNFKSRYRLPFTTRDIYYLRRVLFLSIVVSDPRAGEEIQDSRFDPLALKCSPVEIYRQEVCGQMG